MTDSESTTLSPGQTEAQESPGINWADPNVPAGNAPPMPRWPLWVSAAAFAVWIAFLVAMAVVRHETTSF